MSLPTTAKELYKESFFAEDAMSEEDAYEAAERFLQKRHDTDTHTHFILSTQGTPNDNDHLISKHQAIAFLEEALAHHVVHVQVAL